MKRWKFNIKRTTDQKWMFNLVSGNGEIVATSETYSTKQACLKEIRRIRIMSDFVKAVDLS